MGRMLGTCQRPWCPYCRRPAGADCPDASRSKKAQRAREKQQWRREDLDKSFTGSPWERHSL